MVSMQKYQLTAVIWEEEGVFVSKCPELEVASAGNSPQDALKNLKEAVELFIANAKELNMFEDLSLVLRSTSKFTSTLEVEV